MEDFESWQATHRNLSEIDLKFRQLAKDSPEFLNRASFRALEKSNDLLEFRLQSWITLLDTRKLEEFQRVSVGITRLLLDVPQRVFGRNWPRLCKFLGLPSSIITEVLFDQPTGLETALTRGDFIETASGFKCIELNCTPNLGGWDTGIITRMHLEAPITVRFLEMEGISIKYTETIVQMFLQIIEDLRKKEILRGSEVTIAFVVSPTEEHLDQAALYFQGELERAVAMAGLDLESRVVFCDYADLTPHRDALAFGGRWVDALIELRRLPTPPPVYRAFKAGRIALYNGPLAIPLSSKRNVALLSEFASSGLYTPGERELIEAHVPWTRLVVPGPVKYEEEPWSLVDLLTVRQERFVLKQADSWGGKGVFLGRNTPAEEWSRAIDTALAEGSWIVQEFQESLPYLYQSGDYGCSVHDMIWGPFVFGSRYGGVVLRMQPRASGGAVNLSLHATEGIVLEV